MNYNAKADSVLQLYLSELETLLSSKKWKMKNGVDVSDINMFMEGLTGIESESNHHSFVGILEITEDTFNQWESWCTKYRYLIVWDEENNGINRTDIDIYKTKSYNEYPKLPE